MLFANQYRAALLCRLDNQLFIERLDGMHIDEANADAFFIEGICCKNGFVYQYAAGDDGYIVAVSQEGAFADFELAVIGIELDDGFSGQIEFCQ